MPLPAGFEIETHGATRMRRSVPTGFTLESDPGGFPEGFELESPAMPSAKPAIGLPRPAAPVQPDSEGTSVEDAIPAVEAAAPTPPPPQPAPPPTIGRTLRDVGSSVESGFANAITTTGQLVGMAGRGLDIQLAADIGEAVRTYGQAKEDWWEGTMAEANREPRTFGRKALFSVSKSAPSMVLAFVPAAGVNVALKGAAGVAKAAGFARTAAAVTAKAPLIAGALSEGLQAAGQNAAQARQEIAKMPLEQLAQHPEYQKAYAEADPALDETARQNKAREAVTRAAESYIFKKTVPWTGGISLLTGAGVIGQILDKPTMGILKNFLQGTGREAIQEVFQSGGEQLFQDVAAQDNYDIERAVNPKAIGEAALLGGIAGAVMGGAGGAAKGVETNFARNNALSAGMSPQAAARFATSGLYGSKQGQAALASYQVGRRSGMDDQTAADFALADNSQTKQMVLGNWIADRDARIRQDVYAAGIEAGIPREYVEAAAMSDDPQENLYQVALFLEQQGQIEAAQSVQDALQQAAARRQAMAVAPRTLGGVIPGPESAGGTVEGEPLETEQNWYEPLTPEEQAAADAQNQPVYGTPLNPATLGWNARPMTRGGRVLGQPDDEVAVATAGKPAGTVVTMPDGSQAAVLTSTQAQVVPKKAEAAPEKPAQEPPQLAPSRYKAGQPSESFSAEVLRGQMEDVAAQIRQDNPDSPEALEIDSLISDLDAKKLNAAKARTRFKAVLAKANQAAAAISPPPGGPVAAPSSTGPVSSSGLPAGVEAPAKPPELMTPEEHVGTFAENADAKEAATPISQIVAENPPGPARDAAITRRVEAGKRLARSLGPGDVVELSDGQRGVVAQNTGGFIEINGEDGKPWLALPTDDFAVSLMSGQSPDGKMDYAAGRIVSRAHNGNPIRQLGDNSGHRKTVRQAMRDKKPVSVAAVDAYGIKLPEGYVRDGDRYVYRGTPGAEAGPGGEAPAEVAEPPKPPQPLSPAGPRPQTTETPKGVGLTPINQRGVAPQPGGSQPQPVGEEAQNAVQKRGATPETGDAGGRGQTAAGNLQGVGPGDRQAEAPGAPAPQEEAAPAGAKAVVREAPAPAAERQTPTGPAITPETVALQGRLNSRETRMRAKYGDVVFEALARESADLDHAAWLDLTRMIVEGEKIGTDAPDMRDELGIGRTVQNYRDMQAEIEANYEARDDIFRAPDTIKGPRAEAVVQKWAADNMPIGMSAALDEAGISQDDPALGTIEKDGETYSVYMIDGIPTSKARKTRGRLAYLAFGEAKDGTTEAWLAEFDNPEDVKWASADAELIGKGEFDRVGEGRKGVEAVDAEREAKITAILDAADEQQRNLYEPVRRGDYWVRMMAREGTTVGDRFPTEDALKADIERAVARKRAEFASELAKMPPDRIQSQYEYWVKPAPAAEAPKPTKAEETEREQPLPDADTQTRIDAGLAASAEIRGTKNGKTVRDAYFALKTAADGLGITLPEMPFTYFYDRYRDSANAFDLAVGQKYGSYPTAAVRAKRDAIITEDARRAGERKSKADALKAKIADKALSPEQKFARNMAKYGSDQLENDAAYKITDEGDGTFGLEYTSPDRKTRKMLYQNYPSLDAAIRDAVEHAFRGANPAATEPNPTTVVAPTAIPADIQTVEQANTAADAAIRQTAVLRTAEEQARDVANTYARENDLITEKRSRAGRWSSSWREAGAIKKSAPKAKVTEYDRLKKLADEAYAKLNNHVREVEQPAKRALERAHYAQIARDEKAQEVSRLAARKALADTDKERDAVDFMLYGAAAPLARELYPDATDAEVKALVPEIARVADGEARDGSPLTIERLREVARLGRGLQLGGIRGQNVVDALTEAGIKRISAYNAPERFVLESGAELPDLREAYSKLSFENRADVDAFIASIPAAVKQAEAAQKAKEREAEKAEKAKAAEKAKFDAEARATADKGRAFSQDWKPPFQGATHPVEALGKIANPKATLPILGMIAVQDGVGSATDLDATVQAKVPLPDGIYRRLPGSDILIIEQGPEGLEEFPYGLNKVEKPVTVKLADGREFMQALKAAQAAMSTDQTRWELMNVWLSKINAGALAVSASDGRRLVSTTVSADASAVPDGWSVGLNPSAVTALLADPHGESLTIESGQPELREDGSQSSPGAVRFSNGNTTVTAKLPDVAKPDFAPLLAQATAETLTVDRKAFNKALSTLKKMAGKVRDGVVVGITREGGTLTLTTKDARGKTFSESVDVEVSAGRQAQGMVSVIMPWRKPELTGDAFSLPYLADAAKAGTSAKVSFGMVQGVGAQDKAARAAMFESAIEELPKAPDTTPAAAAAWEPDTLKGKPAKAEDMLRAGAPKNSPLAVLSRMYSKGGVGRTTDLENEVEAPTGQSDGVWEARGNSWVPAEESPDEFPSAMKIGKPVAAFKFSGKQAEALKAGLLAVQSAQSTDQTRYVLNSVLLEVSKDGAVSLVGTDGRRLHVATAGTVTAPKGGESVQMILRPQAVKLLLQSNGAGPVTVKVGTTTAKEVDGNGNEIKVRNDIAEITDGNITLRTKLIDGSYPNFRQVIPNPDDQKIKLRVNRKALGQAIADVMPYVGTDPKFEKNISLRLDVSGKQIVVRTNGNRPQYSLERTVPVAQKLAFEGERLSILFSPGFLLDMVKAGDSETVELGLADELAPMTVASEDGTQKGVLMPIRLAARGEAPAADTSPVSIPIESLTSEVLARMDKIAKREGYDSRGGKDVREYLVTGRTLQDGTKLAPAIKNGMLSGEWAAFYREATGRVEARVKKASDLRAERAKHTHVNRDRLRALGYTTDLREAGYITPTGQLIDLSGKREGGSPHQRNYDHREAGGTAGMEEFMAEGNIRINGDRGQIDIAAPPTDAQMGIIEDIIAQDPQRAIIDVWDGLGTWDHGNQRYNEPERRAVIEMHPGWNWRRLLNEIRAFYDQPRFSADLLGPQPRGVSRQDFDATLADETRAVPFAAEGVWAGRWDDADELVKAAVEGGEGQAAVEPRSEEDVIADLRSRADGYVEWAKTEDVDAADNYNFEQWLDEEHSVRVDADGIIDFDRLTPELEALIGDNRVRVFHHSSDKIERKVRTEGLRADVRKRASPYKNSGAGVYVTTEVSGPAVEGYLRNAAQAHRGGEKSYEIITTLDRLREDPDDSDLSSVAGRQFIMSRVPPDDIRFHRSRNGQVRAVTIGQRSYFFLDRYDNASQLRGDIREEAGHRLVNEMGGAAWRKIGLQAYRGRWSAIDAEIQRNYGVKPGSSEYNHELVAKAFRDGQHNVGLLTRFIDAVVAAFRGLARRLGLNVTLSDAEVRNALRGMLEAKARGMSVAAQGQTAFSRKTRGTADDETWKEYVNVHRNDWTRIAQMAPELGRSPNAGGTGRITPAFNLRGSPTRSAGLREVARIGWTLVAVNGLSTRGVTEPNMRVVFVSADQSSAKMDETIRHEVYHALREENDPKAQAIAATVDMSGPAFAASAKEWIRQHPLRYAQVRSYAARQPGASPESITRFTEDYIRDELVGDYMANGENTGIFRDVQAAEAARDAVFPRPMQAARGGQAVTPKQDARFRELTKTWTPGGDWAAWKAAHPDEYAELEKMRAEVLKARPIVRAILLADESGNVRWRVQHSKEPLPKASRNLWNDVESDDEYYPDGQVSFYANLRNALNDFAGVSLDAWGSVAQQIAEEGVDAPALVAATSEYEPKDGPESEIRLIEPQEVLRVVPSPADIAALRELIGEPDVDEFAPDDTGRIPPPSEWGDAENKDIRFGSFNEGEQNAEDNGVERRGTEQSGASRSVRTDEEWLALRDQSRSGWKRKLDARIRESARSVQGVAAPRRSEFEGVTYSEATEQSAHFRQAYEHFARFGFDVVPISKTPWGAAVDYTSNTVFWGEMENQADAEHFIRHETFHVQFRGKDADAIALVQSFSAPGPFMAAAKAKTGLSGVRLAEEIAAAYVAGMDKYGALFTAPNRADLRDRLLGKQRKPAPQFARGEANDTVLADVLEIIERAREDATRSATQDQIAAVNRLRAKYEMPPIAAEKEPVTPAGVVKEAFQAGRQSKPSEQATRREGMGDAIDLARQDLKIALRETRRGLAAGSLEQPEPDAAELGKRLVAKVQKVRDAILRLREAAEALGQADMRQTFRDVTNVIRESLPMAARGRALPALMKIRAAGNIEEAMLRVQEVVENQARRDLTRHIIKSYQKAMTMKAFDVRFRGLVRDIMAGMVLRRPPARVIERLEALRQFVEDQRRAGVEVQLPRQMLDSLNALTAKPIDEASLNELYHMAAGIDVLLDAGQRQFKTKEMLWKERKATALDDLATTTVRIESRSNDQPDLDDLGTVRARFRKRWQQSRDLLTRWAVYHRTVDIMADVQDGGRGYKGATTRWFRDLFTSPWGAYLNKRDSDRKAFGEIVTRMGVGDKEATRIGIYAVARQQLPNDPAYGRKKLYNVYDARTTEAQARVDRIIDGIRLTPKEQAVYDWMQSWLDRHWDPINRYTQDVWNFSIDRHEWYFPMITDWELADNTPMAGLMVDEKTGMYVRAPDRPIQKTVEQGFTQQRRGAGNQKVMLNAVTVMQKHMDDVAYALSMGEAIKFAQEVASSPRYRDMAGDVGQKYWQEYFTKLARKGGAGGQHTIRILDIIRRNLGLGTLGFNPISAIVQPTSLIDAFGMIGPQWGMVGAYHIATPGWHKFIYENMPEVRDRIGDDSAFGDVGRWGKYSFKALAGLDRITSGAVAAGAYARSLHERGLSVDLANPDAEAIQYAQRMVRLTQASGSFKDQPLAIARMGSISRAFYQFQTFPMNKFWLIQHEGLANVLKRQDWGRGVGILIWSLLAFMAEEAVRKGAGKAIFGQDRDDKESVPMMALWDFLHSVPGLGSIISAARYGSTPVPALEVVSRGAKGIAGAMTAKAPATRARGLLQTLGAAGAAAGVPGATPATRFVRSKVRSDQEDVSAMIHRAVKGRTDAEINAIALKLYQDARREGLLKPGTTFPEFRSRVKAAKR